MNNSPRNVVADIVAIAHADLRRNFRDRAMTARDPDTAASRLLADVDDPAERGGSEIAGDRGETVARRNKSRRDPLISHARARTRARSYLAGSRHRGVAASPRAVTGRATSIVNETVRTGASLQPIVIFSLDAE